MRIIPGAAVVGVAVGSAIAQTAAVVYWWLVVGPWYFAWDYRVIGGENTPIPVLAVANVVVAGLIGLVPALVFVPLMRRWAALQRAPWVLIVLVLSIALACVPFTILHSIPDARTFVLVTVAGGVIAVVAGAIGTRIADRRRVRDAAALAAAFTDYRP